jgi:flagellar basal-body rod modification protein FlgD
MQVGTTTSSTASPTAQAAASQASSTAKTLGYDAFLQLLIAELKNQDPTKPMDSAQYIGQLASFSNVEQSVKTNAKLDALMTSINLAQAEGMIGHAVTSADGATAGTVVSVEVTSDGPRATLDNGKTLMVGPGITIS